MHANKALAERMLGTMPEMHVSNQSLRSLESIKTS